MRGAALGFLGCLILGPVSIFLLTKQNWAGFGVCFVLDVICSIIAMSFLFHPYKYFKKIFSLPRIGITLTCAPAPATPHCEWALDPPPPSAPLSLRPAVAQTGA